MNASKEKETKLDTKKLEKYNLVNKKWKYIQKIVKILFLFAKITEKLEGNKYAIMSYIHSYIE